MRQGAMRVFVSFNDSRITPELSCNESDSGACAACAILNSFISFNDRLDAGVVVRLSQQRSPRLITEGDGLG